MYLSKAYNDNDKRLVIKRNAVHSVILPSVKKIVLDGNEYHANVDHFSLKKVWKGIKDVGKTVINVSPVGAIKKAVTGKDLLKMETKVGQKVAAKTSSTRKVAAVTGLVLGGGIAAAGAAPALTRQIKDIAVANKNPLLNKGKDELITKGKELAISKGTQLAKDLLTSKINGDSTYSTDQKIDSGLMYSQDVNSNEPLLAGTPISFSNPWTVIGIVIFFIILIAIKKMK